MTRRRKQNIKLALVCAILGAIVLMTIFAPWLAPYDPLEVNMELRLLDPCRAHPLGTDALGRDVLRVPRSRTPTRAIISTMPGRPWNTLETAVITPSTIPPQ